MRNITPPSTPSGGKYDALPGDISAAQVTQFGFTVTPTRAGTQGRGDGNGLIEGVCYGCGDAVYGWAQQGETTFFWEDLSANSNLIEGSFTTATDGSTTDPACSGSAACTDPWNWTPAAKLGNGNYVYVYSSNGVNYFGLSAMATNAYGNNALEAVSYASFTLTLRQAYDIDAKVDDGRPQSGNMEAVGLGYGGAAEAPNSSGPGPGVCFYIPPRAPTTSFYGIVYNGGAGVNCALSFRFQ